MKRLITPLILLLGGPSIASATCRIVDRNDSITIERPACFATSGSMAIRAGETGTSLTVTGPDFQMSGLSSWDGAELPLDVGRPMSEGSLLNGSTVFTSTTANDPFYFAVSIDVPGGVHLDSTRDDNFATVEFDSQGPLTTMPGPGTYSEPFSFSSYFFQPSGNAGFCGLTIQCWVFFGQGTLTFDVGPTTTPGFAEILDATYTFNKPVFTPEPSTATLFLLGFAGLALLGRRDRSRATLLSAS